MPFAAPLITEITYFASIATNVTSLYLAAPAPPVNVDVNTDAADVELLWRAAAVLVVGGALVALWNYAPRVLLVALAFGALMLIGSVG